MQGIPGKGVLLTQMSLFWFERLKDVIPNHLITSNVDEMPEDVQVFANIIRGRSMLVRRAKVVPLEAITRGYITGELKEALCKGHTNQCPKKDLHGPSTNPKGLCMV